MRSSVCPHYMSLGFDHYDGGLAHGERFIQFLWDRIDGKQCVDSLLPDYQQKK